MMTVQQNCKEGITLHSDSRSRNGGTQALNDVRAKGESVPSQNSFRIDTSASKSLDPKSALSIPAVDFKNLMSMDDVVRQSLISDYWKIVESKRSRLLCTLPCYSVKSLVPPSLAPLQGISPGLPSTETPLTEQKTEQRKRTCLTRSPLESSHIFLDSARQNSNYFSNETGTAAYIANSSSGQPHKDLGLFTSEVNTTRLNKTETASFVGNSSSEQPHNNLRLLTSEANNTTQKSRDYNGHMFGNYDDDIDEAVLNVLRQKRSVPLPDFDGLSADEGENRGRDYVDYSSQWSLQDKGSLCFYDNLAGVDMKKPLFMFVPRPLGGDEPRVGELELDQLSELSENMADSDVMLEMESDLEEADSRRRNPSLSRADSSVQTDDLFPVSYTREIGTMTAADVIAEIRSERLGNNRKSLPTSPQFTISSEGNEVDPAFAERPCTLVEVLEGEPLTVMCKLTGTTPIDVFWFRDVGEVTQLEENDACDMRRSGDTFTLDLFNISKKDSGHYLCIGVNLKGHCVRGFQVNVLENTKPKIPVSFSVLPQNVTVLERSEAMLWCKVTGYPPPSVSWYCGKDRLRNGEKFRIERDDDGTCRLIISDVGEKSTEYSLVAENLNGRVTATACVVIQPRDLADTDGESLNIVTSPYPDLADLVEIVQKVSPTASTTPKRSSRFLFSTDKIVEYQESNVERAMVNDQPHVDRETSESEKKEENFNKILLPLVQKVKSLSDDEAELSISYKDFERLFKAKLISRSQLNSGRVWKKDLEKINAFLKKNSTDDGKGFPAEAKSNDDLPLRINCGLKKINPKFYQRDYVISKGSAKHNGHHEPDSMQNQPAMGKMMRWNSLPCDDLSALSARPVSYSNGDISFQQKETRDKRLEIASDRIAEKPNTVHQCNDSERTEGGENNESEDEDMLPCLRELIAKFGGASLSPEKPESDVSPLKRIRSLTGRSVPEFVRERIQRHLSNVEPQSKQNQGNVYSLTIDSDHIKHREQELANNGETTSQCLVQNFEQGSSNADKQSHLSKVQHVDHVPTLAKSNLEKLNSKEEEEQKAGRINSWRQKPHDTVVLRRAMYWQNRILHQTTSDTFPEMPDNSSNGNET